MCERKHYFKAVNYLFFLLYHSWCSIETHILRFQMVFATFVYYKKKPHTHMLVMM